MRVIVFFLPLPEPLPLPHHEVFTFFGETHPQLAGLALQPTRETPPFPEEATGRLFTSLRFWQRIIDTEAELAREIEPVDAIVRSIVPPEEYAKLRDDPTEVQETQRSLDAADEEGLRDELRTFGVPEEEIDELIEAGPPVDYQTVVEAVTPLVEVNGEPDPLSAAFDRCVNYLAKLASAYRRASHRAIAPITRERLPFHLYYVTYEAGEPKPNWSHGLFIPHMSAPELLVLPPATPEQLADIKRHLAASLAKHPLTPYVDRVIDAQHALRLGDTANTVILGQLAAEVFLDAVLGLVLWEEESSAEDAATREFATDLTPRVRHFFAPRLGGDWNLKGSGAVGDWKRQLYELRGRVIHGGYQPSRAEAAQALEALARLEEFIKMRIVEKKDQFPKVALIVLGPDGLSRRGGWSKAIREFAEKHADNTWLAEYNHWGENVSAAK